MCVLDAVEIRDNIAVADTTILIDHNNGKEPVNYHFDILMELEDGEWHVNPECLTDYQLAVNKGGNNDAYAKNQ